VTVNPPTQYATDANLAARQRLWSISERRPPFDLFDWVLDRVGMAAGDERRILDVGCGNGRYERELRDRGHQGVQVAIDLSRGMLDHVEAADRMQSDVQRLPLVTSAFDVVLAPHMLYHVPDVAAAACELRRVLRPGGVCIAVTNGESNVAELRGLVETAVGAGWRMARPSDQRFSLENGAAQLSKAFDRVERVDCPPGDLIVTDLGALTDYVASVADHYESQVAPAWSEVVARVRELAHAELSRSGAFRMTSAVGGFLCT
jgi:SAM-dependent methyltransferase